jgi:O-antigen ligase
LPFLRELLAIEGLSATALGSQLNNSLRTSASASAAGLPGLISTFVFYSLLVVIALVAIPYGTVEPWWKSLFQCLVFALAGLSVIGNLLRREQDPPNKSWLDYQLLWPVLALIVFAFLQTIRVNGLALSADVFQTRQFVIHLCALLTLAGLLITHTNNLRRLRRLLEIVIVVGVVSALFGLWRQASQSAPGFVLPALRPGYGYAQFINSNHFAFLMELALGLALGIVVCRGVSGRRLAIYLSAAVPMWIALVLANSRGGIVSILCQVLFLALLLSVGRDSRTSERDSGKITNRLLHASRNVAVRGVLVAALLVGAITMIVVVGGDPLAGRVDSLAVELDRKTADRFTLRPAIWRATWELIKDHPIAGVGFGGYGIAITRYHAASGEMTPQEAHNDYLELLANGGVIGLAIGLWFALALVRTAKRKLDKLRSADAVDGAASFERAVTLGAMAGILTVAIHSLVDFGLHITINAVVFTVLVAIVAGKPVAIRSQKSEVINQ